MHHVHTMYEHVSLHPTCTAVDTAHARRLKQHSGLSPGSRPGVGASALLLLRLVLLGVGGAPKLSTVE